jgi:hypothetical protein
MKIDESPSLKLSESLMIKLIYIYIYYDNTKTIL